MKKMSMLLALAAVAGMIGVAGAAEYGKVTNDVGIHGVVINPGDGDCGTLNLNSDSSYENGFCWQYGGVVPPDYGAFAECYSGDFGVCAVVLDLTQIGNYTNQRADVYVWQDGGGVPGAVACLKTGVNVGSIAFWPSLSRHVIAMDNCCVTGSWWTGYWGNWPGGGCAWYVGADLDGFGGCPFTNVAPGIGFPTGWGNVSAIWGPTQAIGIGAETVACGPVPTESKTWGAIKNLYN